MIEWSKKVGFYLRLSFWNNRKGWSLPQQAVHVLAKVEDLRLVLEDNVDVLEAQCSGHFAGWFGWLAG